MPVELRTIGAAGELPLSKEHAGRIVAVEELETGVWMVKTARVVPDNELWLLEPAVARKLDRAIAWAESHPRKTTDLSKLESKLLSKPATKSGKRRSGRK
jgi:hypothetical protein